MQHNGNQRWGDMRPRVVAASTATLIAAASLAPLTAQAAGQNTLFVNGASSACTDSGTGTLAAPFCSLQVAADAASSGDIVNVAPGNYGAVSITRSGTASAPIIFTGNGVQTTLGESSAASAAISLSGADYVTIENFSIPAATAGADTVVDGGTGDVFLRDLFNASAALPAVHVTDGASGITVEDSRLLNQILVDGGSTGTIISTNRITGTYAGGVSVVGATGTAVTSNTVNGCGPAVSVTDGSTGTAIENNLIVPLSNSCATPVYGLTVDSSAASTTTADYNGVYTPAGPEYEWAGSAYGTAASLYNASGQGKHDDNAATGLNIVEKSPLIDSADSSAIGEQSTDMYGHPRVDDPVVASSGAGTYDYYDRGAVEFQDPVASPKATLTTSVYQVPVGGSVTLNGSLTDSWSDTFHYQFGMPDGTRVDGGTSGTANVSFDTAGTYAVWLYAAPASNPNAYVGYTSARITVVPQAPLVPQIAASADGPLGVAVSDGGTTDGWLPSGVTFDFGDQSATQTVGNGVQASHTYAKAGTYTITETVTDQGGATATTSTRFTTAAAIPGTLINMLTGGTPSTPADSTGISQVAATTLPDNSSQLVAATSDGGVEFSIGVSDGTAWSNWQPLPQSGVTAKRVGIAGMPNGSSQIIEITSAGTLKHTVRNADGSWQVSGWGSPAGSSGFVDAAITALPDGSAQLVAVTTAGVLMHDIRYANGSWQGWRALSQPGVKITDAAIAGLPDGSTQIVEVTSGQVMKHNIRNANGSWQKTGWGTPAGATGITQVSISGMGMFHSPYGVGESTITAVTAQGGVESVDRYPGGAWGTWWGQPSGLGSWGTATSATVSSLIDNSYVMFATTKG